jgi:hypothetical protein
MAGSTMIPSMSDKGIRRIYMATIFGFLAASQIAFCAWIGMKHLQQMTSSLAGVAFLLGAAGLAVTGIHTVRAYLQGELSKSMQGAIIAFYLTIWFFIMTLAEIIRQL